MLMTVIMTIVVAGITATIMLRFRDEETSMAKVVFGSVAVGLSVSVLNNYLVPDHSGLAWLFMLICFAFIGALVYQWLRQGSDLIEFLCFTALTLIVGGIACAAAANYKSVFPMLLSVWVPILAIGYYGVTAMKFHAVRNTLSDDERAGLLKQEKQETIDEMDSNAARFHRLMALVAAVTVIVLACTTGLVLGINDNNDTPNDQTQVSVATTASAAEDDTGDAQFEQNWAKNENNRIDSEFLPKLLKEADGDEITEDDFETVLLDDCAHDARILAIVANNLKLKDDTSYDNLLTSDKKYLSDEGEKLYYKVEGALETANLLRTEVDSSGTNTGMNDNSYVVNSEAGVSGELEGTRIVTRDGETTFYILDRCANVVYPGGIKPPKKVPKGDTDEPDSPSKKKKNMKDQTKKPKKNTEPNDDKGPGENTNNPSNPNKSKKDTSDSSTSGSYDDYKKNVDNLKNTNKNQKTGSDSNKPSTPAPSSNTHVDNNGDKGNGGAPINTPTPKQEAQTTKNDPAAGHMDEPS